MLIIVDKEAESGMLSVRSRSAGDIGAMSEEDFVNKVRTETENLVLD